MESVPTTRAAQGRRYAESVLLGGSTPGVHGRLRKEGLIAFRDSRLEDWCMICPFLFFSNCVSRQRIFAFKQTLRRLVRPGTETNPNEGVGR